MKICYFANAGSIHTYRWVNYFADKHQVYLISLKEPKFDYGKVKIKVIKKIMHKPGILSHAVNFLPVLFQLRRFFKKNQFDILHALASGEGWLASLIGFHPFVLTIADPGILSDLPKHKYYNFFNRSALKKADLITTDGENTKKAMLGLGADPQKIKIIRFGVDIQKIKSEKNGELKKKLFGENAKIVISTKPLRVESNLETLINAAPLILKEIPEAKFILAGDGDQKEYLIDLAKSLNVFEAIKFIGWVPSEELPSYLNSADAYVSTSLTDSGLASSTAEAMACEVPVVVSDSGDNKILIKDGENGFLFPVKNFKILAEKLIALLKSDDLQEKFSLAHRKWVEENNNYQKEMEKMENIYQELTNGK